MKTNPMDLTEKDALEICVLLWSYLEDYPSQNKSRAIKNLGLPVMAYNCAACAYAIQRKMALGYTSKDRCEFCPMWKGGAICTDKGQAFHAWHIGSTNDRIRAARAIKELALQRLEELKNG